MLVWEALPVQIPLECWGRSEAPGLSASCTLATVSGVGEERAGGTGPQKTSYEDAQQVSRKHKPRCSRERSA